MLYFLENSPKIHQKIKVLQNGCINSTPWDSTGSMENQDKSKPVKYRVRIILCIIRKDFKTDKLFDDLIEAKEFLFNSKTKDGIKSIEIAREEAIVRESAKLIKQYFNKRTISHYAKFYIESYVDTIIIDTEMRKKLLLLW